MPMGDLANLLCDTIRAADEAARFRLDIFHRLVYADYLEKCGNTGRAMAIRLHAAIEETRPGLLLPLRRPAGCPTVALEGWRHSLTGGHRKLSLLWTRHRREWRALFPRMVRAGLFFRAGLPWRFDGLPQAWPRQATGELALVRSWQLWADAGQPLPYIGPQMLSGAWEVVLSGQGWRGHVARLLDSGVIPATIGKFGLTDGALDAQSSDEIRATLDRPWPNLRSFIAPANWLYHKGAAAVWDLMTKTPVRELDLSRNNIGWGTGFLRQGGPPALRVLRFNGNHVEARGTRVVAGAPFLDRVERIDWMGNSLSANGAEALAAWRVPCLRAVHLGSNHLGPEGAKALSACRWMSGLVELELSENQLRNEGVAHLARCLGQRMRALGLEGNLLDGASGTHLAESPARASMSWLEISRNRLGAEGVTNLASAEWPRLRHAGLMMNDLPPESLFPKSRFPRLAPVSLARPEPSEEGRLGTRRDWP